MTRLLAITASAALLCCSISVHPQETKTSPASSPQPQAQPQSTATQSSAPTARPEDVTTLKAIVMAIYDTISGPAGERDWKRFHSLFLPEGARLIVVGKRPDGTPVRRVMTPDDYQRIAGENMKKDGFFESSPSNKVERFGRIAHVFSTYESRHEKGGKPFTRGINSMQFANDGTRWYCVSILWDQERPDNPIPSQYLTGDDLNDEKLGGK